MSFEIKPSPNVVDTESEVVSLIQQNVVAPPQASPIVSGVVFGKTSQSTNTSFGYQSLMSPNTQGQDNTAMGITALKSNTSGYGNTALGSISLAYNETGNNNTAVGASTLTSNLSGSNNVAIGMGSLNSNYIGYRNTAIGRSSLSNNTEGFGNVAIGYYAISSNIDGANNVAIGDNSLFSNSSGQGNTAAGFRSLNNNSAGIYNTAVGQDSLISNTTGSHNTAIGKESLQLLSGDSYLNTAIGTASGNQLQSGDNNIFIGANAQPSSSSVSNTVTIGSSSITTIRAQVTSITSLSDIRDKKNVESLTVGLDFINKLNPVKFDWNMRDGGKIDVPDTGFIAQDLMLIEDESGIAEYLKLTYRDNPDKLEASYGRLIPILVKAIQDLSKEVESLKNKN